MGQQRSLSGFVRIILLLDLLKVGLPSLEVLQRRGAVVSGHGGGGLLAGWDDLSGPSTILWIRDYTVVFSDCFGTALVQWPEQKNSWGGRGVAWISDELSAAFHTACCSLVSIAVRAWKDEKHTVFFFMCSVISPFWLWGLRNSKPDSGSGLLSAS